MVCLVDGVDFIDSDFFSDVKGVRSGGFAGSSGSIYSNMQFIVYY